MTKIKNWICLIVVFLLSIGISIIYIRSPLFSIDKVIELGADFHYNAISISAIIGGFLFTGISILISVIDKDRINRLWNGNYLDNLYRSAFVGMTSNVATIIIAFLLVFLDPSQLIFSILANVEIVTIIVGIVFFSWCIKNLLYVVSRLKQE